MNRAFVLAGEQRSELTRVEDKGVSKSYNQTARMAGGSMDYQEKRDAFFDLYQPIYTHFQVVQYPSSLNSLVGPFGAKMLKSLI